MSPGSKTPVPWNKKLKQIPSYFELLMLSLNHRKKMELGGCGGLLMSRGWKWVLKAAEEVIVMFIYSWPTFLPMY